MVSVSWTTSETHAYARRSLRRGTSHKFLDETCANRTPLVWLRARRATGKVWGLGEEVLVSQEWLDQVGDLGYDFTYDRSWRPELTEQEWLAELAGG